MEAKENAWVSLDADVPKGHLILLESSSRHSLAQRYSSNKTAGDFRMKNKASCRVGETSPLDTLGVGALYDTPKGFLWALLICQEFGIP